MSAFFNCHSLESLYMPKNLTKIGWAAFSGCSNLQSIIVSEDNEVFDSRNNCNAIIKTDEDCLLYGCNNTVLSEEIFDLCEEAFAGCNYLKRIDIPGTIDKIQEGVFNGCKSLEYVHIDYGVSSIMHFAFCGCKSLRYISIPETLTYIEQNAFNGCESLTSTSLPGKKIQEWVFINCKSLKTIKGRFSYIGYCAFAGCESLESITLLEEIEHIGEDAFEDCGPLKYSIAEMKKNLILLMLKMHLDKMMLFISIVKKNHFLMEIFGAMLMARKLFGKIYKVD